MEKKARLGMLHKTKGMEVRVDYGDGCEPVFVAGGHRRMVLPVNDGDDTRMVAVNGEIECADGTRYYAILEIDETSSGEHCGTLVFTPQGLAVQGEDGFSRMLNKPESAIFPYRYRYQVALGCTDHHVGLDGWSRGGTR